MRVLVACEFSGIVRDAFRALGHRAISCDLLPCERENETDWQQLHVQGDVLEILSDGWDLMIAHPPCTYLCNSGVRWLKDNPVRAHQRKRAIDFVDALWNAPIPKVAIENPLGCLSTQWRKPDQIIQPWMFGHGETKATCLWLKNLPPLQPTHLEGDLFCEEAPTERVPRVHLEPPGPNRWKNRSRTFLGIARAMAAQWSNL